MNSTSYTLLFENDLFILINKANNVNFHNEDGIGLVTQIKEDKKLDLFPVHRLDKVTSGLILFAKSSSIASKLSHLFENHEIEKYYIALSSKKPIKKMGMIKGDMEKSRNKSWKLLRTNDNPAMTQFKSYSLKEGMRFFLLKPKTGKTHQLRVALKSVGSPILGDVIYGGENADRTYLHSYSLRFILEGENFQFTCLPESGDYFLDFTFKEFIKDFDTPWELL